MTPAEYKAIRKKLGLTQAALAKLLDVSRKAIVDRERTGALISKESALALQALCTPLN